jgi:CRP/FNR family cyclic AMP-dependent transcriptional regulator
VSLIVGNVPSFAGRPSRLLSDGGVNVSESMRWDDLDVCRRGDTFEQTWADGTPRRPVNAVDGIDDRSCGINRRIRENAGCHFGLGVAQLATARAAADRGWHTWKVPSDGFSRQRVEPGGGSDPFANSKILASLTSDDRLQLVDRCIQRRYEKGQIVYCQGEPSESMLILRTGCLKISSFSSEGNELVFSKVLPGEIIGELGILSNVPRSATVTALQLSSALTLRRSVVMELIEIRPAVAVAMLQQLADKVRRTTGAAADIVFLDLAQRVAKFLLQEAAQPSNEIQTTQAELALGVGASRQRVNSCLQEFQRDEWISLAPKSIRLRNPDALRRLMGM